MLDQSKEAHKPTSSQHKLNKELWRYVQTIKPINKSSIISIWLLTGLITFDINNVMRYYCCVIKSYRNKITEKAAKGEFDKKLPTDIHKRIKMRLERINAAADLNDLRVPPSHMLESMKGDREGQYSIRVNKQIRICFEWCDGNAENVEIVDYH